MSRDEAGVLETSVEALSYSKYCEELTVSRGDPAVFKSSKLLLGLRHHFVGGPLIVFILEPRVELRVTRWIGRMRIGTSTSTLAIGCSSRGWRCWRLRGLVGASRNVAVPRHNDRIPVYRACVEVNGRECD